MTPCQELGYNVGDMFRVLSRQPTHPHPCFIAGSIVKLVKDDGSTIPGFDVVIGGVTRSSFMDDSPQGWELLDNVEKL